MISRIKRSKVECALGIGIENWQYGEPVWSSFVTMVDSSTTPRSDHRLMVCAFRYLWRLPLLVVHLVLGLPVTVACIVAAPYLPTFSQHRRRLDHVMIRWWQGRLLWIFGFRIHQNGSPVSGPALFVANHVSWVDICLLHSQCVMGFVAKQEIARWPLIGWLAACAQTIFHQRGSPQSLTMVTKAMMERLSQGQAVGVFPEGGTRDGQEVGAFHARIFQAAVQAQVPIQAVALRYGRDGQAQTRVAFAPRETFIRNFFRLLGQPAVTTSVHFFPIVDQATIAAGRRDIAQHTRAQICSVMPSSSGSTVGH